MKHLKYKFVCSYCKKEKITHIPNKRLCSEDCRKKFYHKGDRLDISSGNVGTIAEIMVCADLLKKGYAVFRSVSPSCFADIVAIKKEECKYIEVRTGYRITNGTLCFPRKINCKEGIPTEYAIYSHQENKIEYILITKELLDKYKIDYGQNKRNFIT